MYWGSVIGSMPCVGANIVAQWCSGALKTSNNFLVSDGYPTSGLISRPDPAHVESGDEALVIFSRQHLEVLVRREEFQLSVLRLAAPSLAKRVHQH